MTTPLFPAAVALAISVLQCRTPAQHKVWHIDPPAGVTTFGVQFVVVGDRDLYGHDDVLIPGLVPLSPGSSWL